MSLRATGRSAAAIALALAASCSPNAGAPDDVLLTWRVTSREPLRDPEQSMTPHPWGVVADPAASRVYVVDGPNHRVLIFDADGSLVDQFGREGAGPGEFRDPWSISIRPDGDLSVFDTGLSRLSRWNKEGRWISSSSVPSNYWGPELADMGDRLVMVTTPPPGEPTVIEQDLTEFVNDGGARVLGTVVQRQATLNLPCLKSPMLVPKPIARRPIWTVKADTVLAVLGLQYEIAYFVEGTRARTVERDVEPVHIAQEQAVDLIREGELRIFVTQCGVDPQTVANSMDWQETVAPVERLTVAPDGRLWVARAEGTLASSNVDIFEADGSYRGTLMSVPQPISFLSPNVYVGFGQDSFGVSLDLIAVAVE